MSLKQAVIKFEQRGDLSLADLRMLRDHYQALLVHLHAGSERDYLLVTRDVKRRLDDVNRYIAARPSNKVA